MEVLTLIIVATLCFTVQRMRFKISYYETKLENRNIEINHVKFMAWWKLWIG